MSGTEDGVYPSAEFLGDSKEDERTTSEFNEPTDRVTRQAVNHSNYHRRTMP